MFCTKCGSKVEDGALFCTNCGNSLQQTSNPGDRQSDASDSWETQYRDSHTASMQQEAVNSTISQQLASNAQAQMQPTMNVQNAGAIIQPVSDKSKTAAALLSFFLGGLGIHRFYVGRVGSGIAMLLLTIFGAILTFAFVGILMLIAVGIWDLVDFIIILTGGFKDGQGRYIKN